MPAERPTQPTSDERRRDQDGPHGGEAPHGSPAAGAERYGPVALERMTKDDGRLLILYTSVGEQL
jgi:hypothetical protein